MSSLLTHENYNSGYLIDEELMGGVAADPEKPGSFFAYVLRHSTGESLGTANFDSLDAALTAINEVKRDWSFEKLGGCGGTRCAEGKCKGTSCKLY